MCVYAASKFTLCGCIQDEWSHLCNVRTWCSGRRLIQLSNYRKMCNDCQAQVDVRARRAELLRVLEGSESGDNDDGSNSARERRLSEEILAHPHTESDITHRGYPVPVKWTHSRRLLYLVRKNYSKEQVDTLTGWYKQYRFIMEHEAKVGRYAELERLQNIRKAEEDPDLSE